MRPPDIFPSQVTYYSGIFTVHTSKVSTVKMELSLLSLVPHIKYQSEQYIKCDDTSPGKYHQYFLSDCSKQVDTLLQLNWFYSLFVLTFGQTASSVPECRAAAAVPRPDSARPPW